MSNPLVDLGRQGQSVWYDSISRSLRAPSEHHQSIAERHQNTFRTSSEHPQNTLRTAAVLVPAASCNMINTTTEYVRYLS